MPFKYGVDPKTGKVQAYTITGGGKVWLADGKPLNQNAQVPTNVKREATRLKDQWNQPKKRS